MDVVEDRGHKGLGCEGVLFGPGDGRALQAESATPGTRAAAGQEG